MCECKLILFSAFVLCNVIFVTTFNIDQVNYAVYGKDSPSMFGFTVAVHKDRGNRGWVLVGAPEAQSQYQSPNRVLKGGAVYKCRIDSDDVCQEIPFDRQSYSEFGTSILDDKSHQWFGATLSSSGQKDGPVVACAPRYVWFTRDLNRRDPVGTCFVANGAFDHFEEYSPCRTMNWGYHRQGSGQAGFSAAINKVGDRLYVGAPGSYYWQGQMYSIDAHATFNFTPGIYGNKGYGAKGSVHQQSLETRPAVFSTREGKPPDDDSYMGYSMVVGHFQENQEYEGIAVGMPRGNNLRGKVLLFSWDLKNYKNLTVSKQIGSYFGYSITAADVNGDKKLDIIVGAPMHTEPNNEMKYDVGRVYVFYQSSNFVESFSTSHFIDGIHSKSRFGHAVATLGDLNQDGFDDFAVGAPYDGPNGRGAVYIYYGSKKGIRKKFGQVIYAESIKSSVPLTTFGFSLTGGIDLDGNDYPDMAVGAYLSDAAFFFRSRPVVLVDASVRFHTLNKQIDIREKNCRLPNGLDGSCTNIDFCFKYTGKGIPQQIYLIVQYILDSKKSSTPRMGFMERGTHTFNDTLLLYKDSKELCTTEQVYIKSDIRDKLTPLEAEVKYFITDESQSGSNKVRNPRSQLRPVLDLNSPPSRKDSIVVQKNCGPDNVCIPDLHVNITSNVEKYLLGSKGNLEFDVIVSNFGEDSFETTFEMKYPEGIFYKKIEIKPDMPGILCSPAENRTIICDIGNPLPSGKIALFKILLQPFHKEGMAPTYEFDIFVNSTNPELNSTKADNHKHVSIGIWIDASLELRGESYPPTVHYNESLYTAGEIVKESDIGPQVTHVYYVRNSGPATIQEAEIFILWPLQTLGGEDLLYLLDQPHTQGNVKCDAGLANYKHYNVDYHVVPIWDRLKIDISSVEQTSQEKLWSSKTTEIGKGVSSGVGVVNREGTLETDIITSGDSSHVFESRHNESSGINSEGTINSNGEYIHTEARQRTTWINGVAHTTWENVTTVKDANGKILRTSYSNYNNGKFDNTAKHGNVGTGRESHHYVTSKPEIVYSHSGSQDAISSGSDFTITGAVTNQEERIRLEEQRRLEQKQKEDEVKRQKQQERLRQEELRKKQEEDRIRQEEIRRNEQLEERRRQEHERIRQEEERRRYEEELRRRDETRLREEESRRRHGSGYGQGEITYEDRYQGQTHSTADQEEERRRYYEEERRRQEEIDRQGGIQESGQNQYEQRFSNQGSLSGRGHVLTGYYDQEGVYHDYPKDPSGQIIYNKTYTIESTGSIPIDISGGQSGQNLNFGETALGGGFTVQTLDLGNAASESSLAESQNRFYGGGTKTSGSSDGYGYNQASSQGGSSSNRDYRREWHSQGSYSQSGQIPPTFVHNNIERDNVPTDRPNPNSRSRGKRMVDPYAEIQSLVKCNSTTCNYIRCVVGVLDKDKEVAIALRSRLNVREVKNLTSSQAIKVSSMMVGKISKLPYVGSPRERVLKEYEIFTEIPAKEAELVPEVAPLWIYIVSAVAGVVMLLLLIWILHKCGFFKRNRPSSAPERQPLNRNGYHSGDEAL